MSGYNFSVVLIAHIAEKAIVAGEHPAEIVRHNLKIEKHIISPGRRWFSNNSLLDLDSIEADDMK